MIWTAPPDHRPEGGWCVGIGVDRPPHFVESGELVRVPHATGPPMCVVCHRNHRDRLEDREPRP
jgi:hypothetical protein